jgi:hypothetical protein
LTANESRSISKMERLFRMQIQSVKRSLLKQRSPCHCRFFEHLQKVKLAIAPTPVDRYDRPLNAS